MIGESEISSLYTPKEQTKYNALLFAMAQDREIWERHFQEESVTLLSEMEHVSGEEKQYAILIMAMKKILDFDELVLLSSQENDAINVELSVIYASSPVLSSYKWRNIGVINESLKGRIMVLNAPDTCEGLISDDMGFWQATRSVMLIPLIIQEEKLLFICTNREPLSLNLRSRQMISKFIPELTQTVLNIRYRNQLEHMVKSRTRELQGFQEKINNFRKLSYELFWETDKDLRIVSAFGDDDRLGASSHSELPSYDKLVGKNLLTDIIDDSNLDKTERQNKIKILKKVTVEHAPIVDVEMPCKFDDNLIWMRVNGEPLFDIDGKFYGYRGAAINVTKIHNYNQQLIKSRKIAEENSRASTQYLAEISHEIKTPLQAITGLIEILGRSENITDEQKGYLGNIAQSASVLQNILHDVLDYSHISSQSMVMEKINFNIRDTLNSVVTQMQSLAKERNIKISLKFSKNFPNLVTGDPHRLSQIFFNLINNALKFTGEGGVAVSAERFENHMKFSIRDYGPGIPPDTLKNLFTPFVQADSSISRKYGGSGLGLAICKRLVEFMEGTIGVKSVLGEGSTFWFEIPCWIPSTDIIGAQSIRKKKVIHNAKFKILLVEDSKINQFVLKNLLENLGHSVRVAGNGVEAIKAVDEQIPELVLMDIRMPIMDGIEASKNILAKYKVLPIVALTANSSDEERISCHKAGMIDIISKPVGSDILRSKIEELTQEILDRNETLKALLKNEGDTSDNSSKKAEADANDSEKSAVLGTLSSSGEESNAALIADLLKGRIDKKNKSGSQRIEVLE